MVVPYFAQPTGTVWYRLGGRWQTRFDDPQTGGGYAHATTFPVNRNSNAKSLHAADRPALQGTTNNFVCAIQAMHKYRLYVYDAGDRLIAEPMVISADNDEAATGQAEKMRDGVRVELRDGDRLVMRLPSE